MATLQDLGIDLDLLALELGNASHLLENLTDADLRLVARGQLSPEDLYKRDLITYYMGIAGMTICCLGLVGNILSLIVLGHKSFRTSTYSYLSALAVCDCLVLVFSMVLLTKDLKRPVRNSSRLPGDEGLYPYLFPYVHPAAISFQVISIWLTLAFTVDRYLMICHPFIAEPYCTISRARKVIVGLFIGGLLFNLPKFFEYGTMKQEMPTLNKTVTVYDLTTVGRNTAFRELYHSWLYIFFICGVPFIILAVLNAFLIHAVRLSRQRGQEINSAERKRNDTTVMLIGVVVVFFCCQMPALVSRTIWAFDSNLHDSFKKLPLYTINEIGNFLIILNSAINIVPYYFFGKRFRKHFWKLFCQCLLRYKRFQKISRSFSLTMMDRKSSNGSVLKRPSCDVAQPLNGVEMVRVGTKYLSAPMSATLRKSSTDKSDAEGENEIEYEPLPKMSIGNGSLKSADVNTHLLEGQRSASRSNDAPKTDDFPCHEEDIQSS